PRHFEVATRGSPPSSAGAPTAGVKRCGRGDRARGSLTTSPFSSFRSADVFARCSHGAGAASLSVADAWPDRPPRGKDGRRESWGARREAEWAWIGVGEVRPPRQPFAGRRPESMVGGTRLVPPEDDSSEFSSGLGPQPCWRRSGAHAPPKAECRLTTPSTLSRGTQRSDFLVLERRTLVFYQLLHPLD